MILQLQVIVMATRAKVDLDDPHEVPLTPRTVTDARVKQLIQQYNLLLLELSKLTGGFEHMGGMRL